MKKFNVYACKKSYEVMVMSDEGTEYYGDYYLMEKAFLKDYDACAFLNEDHSSQVYEFMVKRHNGKRVFVNHEAKTNLKIYDVEGDY